MHQEDGSKDIIVHLFSAMDKSHGTLNGVSLSEFLDYLSSKHFITALEQAASKNHFSQFEASQGSSHHVLSACSAKEIEQIRHKLLAASYTAHGADVGALYDRIDKDGGGSIDLEEVYSPLTTVFYASPDADISTF